MKTTYTRGAWLVDTQHNKVGRVMDAKLPGVYYLRPPGGGKEWSVPRNGVRAATADEAQRANAKEHPPKGPVFVGNQYGGIERVRP
ncbi:hypothetical protein [Streptomyces luteireticuli]|uniref:hypothetical protein n=1 Tax=Streptomyces luteireticuli TaxID=173858 RepID=UPI0035589A0E